MILVDGVEVGLEIRYLRFGLLKLCLIGIKLDRFLFQLSSDGLVLFQLSTHGLDLAEQILGLFTELKVPLLKLVFLLIY